MLFPRRRHRQAAAKVPPVAMVLLLRPVVTALLLLRHPVVTVPLLLRHPEVTALLLRLLVAMVLLLHLEDKTLVR